MDILIWIGAGLTLLGLAGIFYSIVQVARAKRAKLDDDAMREAVRKVLPWNMGALFTSVLGLMMVIVGLSLG